MRKAQLRKVEGIHDGQTETLTTNTLLMYTPRPLFHLRTSDDVFLDRKDAQWLMGRLMWFLVKSSPESLAAAKPTEEQAN